jgi:hypothetical protein
VEAGPAPAGPLKRFTFAYIFAAAAVEPCTDNAFALMVPYADTAAMQVFLHRFSETIAQDEHAVMMLDRAGQTASLCRPTSRWSLCRPTRPS